MGTRVAVALLLAAVWTLVAVALPAFQSPRAPVTQAQDGEGGTASYDVEMLPGVGATGTAADLTETTGWHPDKDTTFLGIDIAAGAGTPVYAAFEVIKNPNLYAQVRTVVTTGDNCRMVEIEIYETASSPGTTDVEVGRVRYIHVVAQVKEGDSIPIAGGSGAQQVGTVIAYTKDGAKCPTGGDHLHQSADVSSDTTSMWRNVDVEKRYEDDGLGFDDYPPVTVSDPSKFCSDTWLFKIYPPVPDGKTKADHAPRATPFEQCAAPDNPPGDLAAKEGDGKLSLTWKTPSLVTAEGEAITGYQIRWRDTASKPDAAWDSDWTNIPNSTATTTSHELATGLTNGTTYAVQVRAVNKAVEQKDSRGVIKHGGGPPATVKGTPRKPTPPPTVTPKPPTVTPTPVKLSTIHLTVTPEGCGTVHWEWDAVERVQQDQTRKLRLHHGSSPTLVATAKSWCQFTSWSGDCSGTSPRCRLKLDSDKTVTASFQRIQNRLSFEERAALYQAANARHTARMAVAAKALFQCLDDQPANTQPCFDGYQAAYDVSIAIYIADRARIAAMP